MRISTSQIYQNALNNMIKQSNNLYTLQQQISSGKRINLPSDDPIAAAKVNLMRQTISSAEQLDKNRQTAESTIASEESILGNTIAVIQKIRELQVAAGDTSYSYADRQSLRVEMDGLLEQFYQMANTQDSQSNYIFSGSKSSTPPFQRLPNNQFVYNGDDTQRFQAIGGGSLVAISDSGSSIFMQVPQGNKDFSVAATAANTGSGSMTTGSVTDRSTYIVDDYTVQFALNSNNEMVVMVTGVDSGAIMPASGLVDDAPLFVEGGTIAFNGLAIATNGQPAAGDSFTITPSQNESMFTTIQRMVDNLNQPYNTPADRAKTVTENNQVLTQIDTVLGHLTDVRAQLGARLNQLAIAEEANADLIDTSKVTLNSLEEVNYAEAISNLTIQLTYLQAAQKSFVQIQGLSVFNYF